MNTEFGMLNLIVFTVYKTFFLVPKGYVPILGGAFRLKNNLRNNIQFDYITDDKGDNKSVENYILSEFSSYYYIWKNVSNYSYISLNHYRRFFVSGLLGKFTFLFTRRILPLNQRKIIDILKSKDVIIPKRIIFDESIYQQYSNRHYEQDLQKLRMVFGSKYPSQVNTFDNYINSNKFVPYAIFISSKAFFEKYMNFVFDIYEDLRPLLETDSYDKYQKRVGGFLLERLFGVYLEINNFNLYEMTVINTDIEIKSTLINKIKSIMNSF